MGLLKKKDKENTYPIPEKKLEDVLNKYDKKYVGNRTDDVNKVHKILLKKPEDRTDEDYMWIATFFQNEIGCFDTLSIKTLKKSSNGEIKTKNMNITSRTSTISNIFENEVISTVTSAIFNTLSENEIICIEIYAKGDKNDYERFDKLIQKWKDDGLIIKHHDRDTFVNYNIYL